MNIETAYLIKYMKWMCFEKRTSIPYLITEIDIYGEYQIITFGHPKNLLGTTCFLYRFSDHFTVPNLSIMTSSNLYKLVNK